MLICLTLLDGMAVAQQESLRGQLSAWLTSSSEKQWGMRYLPEVNLRTKPSETTGLDLHLTGHAFASGWIGNSEETGIRSALELYRGWIRFSTSQLELRAGLQKINFGPAQLVRPLMWFDRIDARDPLQITEGVYGLLARYYFLNNTNLWFWGLIGNQGRKGWEVIPSNKRIPEFGGRVQGPLLSGEMGVSFHHRKLDLDRFPMASLFSTEEQIPEQRLGFDGRWDLGVGLWFEAVWSHQDLPASLLRYQRLFNLGCDYTFGLGNGLHLLNEFLILETAESAFQSGEGISFSALALNYPIGLLYQISAMLYYDWDHEQSYRFINLQRRGDIVSLYLLGFWNPDFFQLYGQGEGMTLFSGRGLQLLISFSH